MWVEQHRFDRRFPQRILANLGRALSDGACFGSRTLPGVSSTRVGRKAPSVSDDRLPAQHRAPVVQLDRARDFYSRRCRFESCQGRQRPIRSLYLHLDRIHCEL